MERLKSISVIAGRNLTRLMLLWYYKRVKASSKLNYLSNGNLNISISVYLPNQIAKVP
jgi:hypothetical protein